MSHDSFLHIPAQLGRLRGQLQLSQEELARRSDVSRMTILRIENGDNLEGVKLGTLSKISSALGVSVKELMGFDQSQVVLSPEEVMRSYTHYYAHLCSPDSFTYTHSMTGELVSFDTTYQSVLGYPWEDLIGRQVGELVTPASCALSHEMRARKLEGLFITRYRVEFRTRGRGLVPAEVTTQLIYQGGKPIGVQGIARPVS